MDCNNKQYILLFLIIIGWTVWLERKITSKVRHNDEIGKLSTQVCTSYNYTIICHML